MVMPIHAATMVAVDQEPEPAAEMAQVMASGPEAVTAQEPEADQAAVTAGNSTDVNSPAAANKFRIATNLAP